MEKKISEIAESFEHLRFDETISLIEQHLKKSAKQDKKKMQSSNQQMKIIQCFRVGALISLGRYHEAATFYQQLVTPQAIEVMGKENPYLLISISELFGQNKEKKLIQLLEKHFPTFDNSKMHRFYLSSKSFAPLSKIFLKQFMTSKSNASQLAQIYLDYLQNIQKQHMLQYSRKSYFRHNQKLNFKLVHMFLQKSLKTSEQHKLKLQKEQKEGKIVLQERQKFQKEVKANRSVVLSGYELKLKLLIMQGRVTDSIALYHQIKGSMKFPFTFIQSILQLKTSLGHHLQIDDFYIGQISRICKKNLDAELYTPFYDHYNRFLNYLKQQSFKINKNIKEQLKLGEENLSFQSLYSFRSDNIQQTFRIYFNSLNSQYNMLTDANGERYEYYRKGDYYKICLKGLLLQLLEISSYLNDEQLMQKYLSQYTSLFKNTLTYSHDLNKYWPFIALHKILPPPPLVTTDNQLIQEINYTKINISKSIPLELSLSNTNLMFENLTKLYHSRLEEVEKNRILQKGQRHISDEFLIMLTDYVRIFIESSDDKEGIFELIQRMTVQLQKSIKTSPFNADLKVRLIYFLSIINHHEELVQTYLTNDIKSVQMQTLGYLFLMPTLQFNLWERYDQFLSKMIRSYHQNQRQTSEYGLKAIKAGELDRVQQFICYRENIMNSYNSLLILFILFAKHRLQNNCEYYLLRINSQLNRHARGQIKLTFNADAKVLNNQLSAQFTFCQIYGLYNNYSLLQSEVQVYLHQHILLSSLSDKNHQAITNSVLPLDQLQEAIHSFQVKDIFDFSTYAFQEQAITFDQSRNRFTAYRHSLMLSAWKLCLKIRINVIKLLTFFVQMIKTPNSPNVNNQIAALKIEILQNIEHLKAYFSQIQYRIQIRTITSIRRSLLQSLNHLFLFRQHVAKSKKLKGLKGAIEQGASMVNEELNRTLLQLSWSKENKREYLGRWQYLMRRDENMERQLQFDGKQMKRVQAKFLNLHKI